MTHSNKLMITYVVDFLRTTNAGTERQLKYLLNSLRERGYGINLISLQSSEFLSRGATRVFPGMPLMTLGASSDVSRSVRSIVRLALILRETKPDIVHTFFPSANTFGILAGKMAGIKTLISSRRDMGYNLTARDILLLKIANRFASAVVSNSFAVRDRAMKLEGISSSKAKVIYNGIPSDGEEDQGKYFQKKRDVVGIVANLNRSVKKVDVFVKAAALVVRSRPDTSFWIIGDGHLRRNLERLALELGISGKTQFFGRRDDVISLVREFSVGVICSESEGLSNSIMEYMAAAVPVVATQVGGNPELVSNGKTGFLIPKDDPVTLASAVETILSSQKMGRDMGREGYEAITRKFGLDRMVQETENLYSSLGADREGKRKGS